MAVFTYTGGVVSMATGSYGNFAVRKGSQVSVAAPPTTTLRSFTEGTPTGVLYEPVNRSYQATRINHTSGFSSSVINLNTTEPYNNGAYSSSAYIDASNIVFDGSLTTGITSASSYNTASPSGEYWAHAYGYINQDFGTALTIDSDRNVWVTGSIDYSSATVTSIAASLTSTASFTNNTTTPSAGTNDDGYFTLTASMPFNHNIFGSDTNALNVITNSWISFQPIINPTLKTFSATSPNWANIQIGAGEASCQRIYWGTFGTAPTRTFRIRFEGTNATTGTLGSPNMVWEFILYESNPDIFDIQIGAWTPPATNFNGISDGSFYFGTFNPTANTGWRFDTNVVGSGQYGNNISLVKYTTKGQYQKEKDFPLATLQRDDLSVISIGRNGTDVGEGIKIGSDGRIYILYTSSSNTYTAGTADNDIGILKIDPDYLYTASSQVSSIVWSKTFGTTAGDTGSSFDIDSNDNLYITGFGGSGQTGQGSNDVVVIKVNKAGNVVWKKTYGATGSDISRGLKLDNSGNVIIWGYSLSTPLGGTTGDWFLLKINGTTGALIWQKHWNIGATTYGQAFENSVDVDQFNNIYVCGYSATSPNAYYVAKLDTNGNFRWSRSVGAVTSNPDAGTSVKYKNGHLYVGGQDSSTTPTPPNESYALGVSKLNADTGALISNYVLGTISTEYAYSIDVDDYGDIYATGATGTTALPGLASATNINAITAKFIVDTPQGGFSLSGNASVWNNRKNVYRYTTGKEYFEPDSIVGLESPIQELFATGAQAVFSGGEADYERVKIESGSGVLFKLQTAPYTVTTTQFNRLTNSLNNTTYYSKSAALTLTSVSNTNPLTGASQSVWRFTQNTSDAGSPTFNAGYITTISNTGTFPRGSLVVVSFFAKAETQNSIELLAYNPPFSLGTNNSSIRFNLISGTTTNLNAQNTPVWYGMIPYENGWWRCYFAVRLGTASNQTTGAGWFQIRMSSASALNDSVLIYGPQLQQDVLTSFIENTGTTALTTTASVEDVPLEATYDTPVTTPSTQLFTISNGNSGRVFVPALSGTGSTIISNVVSPSKVATRYTTNYPYYNSYQIVFEDGVNFRTSEFGYTSGATTKLESEFTFTATVGSITISNGYSNLKFIEQADESTQLFGVTGQHGTRVFVPNWRGQTGSSADGVIGQKPPFTSAKYIPSITGTPPAEYITPTQLVFGNEENIRTVSDGTANYRFQKAAFGGTGQITQDSSADKSFAKVSVVLTAPILFYYTTNIITKLAMRYAGKNPTTPFGGLDIVFEELEPNAPPREFSLSGGSTIPNSLFKLSGSGQTTIGGTVYFTNTKDFDITGNLTTGFESQSEVTFKPAITAPSLQLFSITGQHGTRVFVPNWRASGNINIAGDVSNIKFTSDWVGSSPIQYYDPYQVVFGEGENYYSTEYRLDTTAAYRFQNGTFSGSGSKQISSAQNLFERSERFDIWWGGFGIASRNRVQDVTPPQGLTYVTKIVELLDASNNYHGVSRGSGIKFVAGNTYTISIFAKAAERTQIIFGFDPPAFTSLYEYGIFDLAAGTASPYTGANLGSPTVSIVPYGNGWYRCSVTKTCTTTSSANALSFQIINNNNNFYTGDGTSGLYITGAQLDESDTLSPYVFTDGAPENRVTFKSVSFNPPDTQADTQLFTISGGYTNLKFIEQADESTQLFVIGGSAIQPAANFVWSGSSPIQYYDPYQVVFGEGENYYATEYRLDTTAAYRTQSKLSGSGELFTASGASQAALFRPPTTAAGIQLFTISGGYTDLKFIEQADESTQLFALDGSATNISLRSVLVGSVSTTDYRFGDTTSIEKYTKGLYYGDGYLYALSGSTESVGANPPDITSLFEISGTQGTRIFVPNWISNGSISVAPTSAKSSFTSSSIGSSPIEYFNSQQIVFEDGENFGASEFKYYQYISTNYELKAPPLQGSGTLFFTSGAAQVESFVANPSDITTLFEISGSYLAYGVKFSSVLPPFTGNIFVDGTLSNVDLSFVWVGSAPTQYFDSYQIVFGNEENVVGEYVNTSTANYNSQVRYSGSGTTTISGQSTEVYKSGTLQGTGSIFVSGGYSDLKFIEQADESTHLFSTNGTYSNLQFTSSNVVSGSTSITGTIVEKHIDATSGSGSIAALSGAAEKVTFNPLEENQLFFVTGQHGTRVFVPAWNGTGTTSISGTTSESRTRGNFTGNSPSEYYSSYQIVFGEDENYGAPDLTSTNYSRFSFSPAREEGTGALFSGGLYSNLYAVFRPVDATDSEQLFSITGTLGTKVFVPNWIATGTISTLSGGAEKVTFNPLEEAHLFFVSGSAEQKHIDVVSGSGSIAPDGFFSNLKASYRPVDATDSDPLFSISGAAGVKLKDYVWVSAVVEYDPYEYIINDEWIIPDFIKIKDNVIWDNTNNIYRSTTTQSLTKDWDATGSVAIEGTLGTRVFVPNWIATGNISITGTATDKEIDVPPAGSGSLSVLSGAAESVGVNPPEDTFLFSVSNTATESQTDTISGSGTVSASGTLVEKRTKVAPAGSGEIFILEGGTTIAQRFFYTPEGGLLFILSGSSETVTYNPPEDTFLFSVSNTATESQTDIALPGSGSIGTLSGGVEKVTFNPPEGNQLFDVTGAYSDFKFTVDESVSGTIIIAGTAVDKQIDIASGSGTISLANAASESQTDIAVPGSGTFVFDGAADDLYIKGAEQFGGTLFVIEGGSERVTFNPPEGNQLFDVSGSYSDIKATKDYDASGSITVEGTLGTRVFVPNWISTGGFATLSGAAQRVTFNPPEENQLFAIGGAYSNFRFTNDESGSGSLSVLSGAAEAFGANPAESLILFAVAGAAIESQTDITSGSGSIGTLSGASQSVTFNPPEDTQLFSVSGTASAKQLYGTLIGSGTTNITGTATESQTDRISGSGSIASTGFYSNLKVTFNPPEDTQLFSISGTIVEKHVDVVSGSGQVSITGTATEKHVDKVSGSGSFSVLSGAVEAFGANPPESLILFAFTGTATESQTDRISGSGSIASTGFYSNLKVTFNPPEDTQLFDITGAYSNFRFTTDESGSGTVVISGNASSTQIYGSLIGSGSIASLSGAAEKVTFNPPEDTQLFSVTGAYSNFKAIKSYVGSGEFTITGTAVEKNTESYVASGTVDITGSTTWAQRYIALPGSGSIGTLSGAAEKVTFNPPEDTQLFSVAGAYSNFKASKSYVGSGNIFGISGAAQSVTFNPPEDTQLFVVSGTVAESQTDIALPGSGSIGTLSGAAEKVTFNPPEDTQLFDISGAYSEFKFIISEIVSGNIEISGTVVEKHADIASGSGTINTAGTATESQTDIALPGTGSLFTASGSAEAFGANPSEDTALFAVDGAYSDFKTSKSYDASGEFSVLSGAVVVISISNIATGLFDVSNTANESTTYKSIDGSGTLFTLSEATESTTVNPPEDTQLFSISGNSTQTSSLLYYGGNLVIFGEGSSFFARALVPEQGSGEIFVNGDSDGRIERRFITQGSGSFYGFSGSAESTTNVPPQDTYIDGDGELPDREILFLVYGSASGVKRAFTSSNTVVINTSGTGIIGTALPERVFVTII